MMQHYVLPYPPSINQLYRHAGNRVYKTRIWHNWVDEAVLSVFFQKNERAATIKHPIAIELEVGRPDRRKRDLDNLTKATFDFLQADIPGGAIIEDDSLIHKYEVYWSDDPMVNGIQVTIKEIDGLQAGVLVG